MAATFNDLLDAGVCTGECLFAIPETRCGCRCNGYFHSWASDWVASHSAVHPSDPWYPGFDDIDIIKRNGRRAMVDRSTNRRIEGRRSA